MDVACPFYLPAGVVRVPGSDVCVVVVKLTFALDGSGWGRLARVPEPLSGDRTDAGGRLLYPSDFGLPKKACDVVVVGQTLAERATPLRLRVGRLKKQVEKPSMLGAIGRRGSDAGFASTDQRMPFPTLPLEFSIERPGGALVGALPGPAPSAALIYQGEWRAQYPVQLDVDGVLLDPTRSVCVLTLRGSFRHAGEQLIGLLLLVNPSGNPRTPTASAVSWPRYECETPPSSAPDDDEPPLERGKGETIRLDRPMLPALSHLGRGTQRLTRAEVLRAHAAPSRHDDDETTQVGRPVPPPPDSPTEMFTLPTKPTDVAVDFDDGVDEAEGPDANPTLSMPAVASTGAPAEQPSLERSKAGTAAARPHDPSRDTLPFDRPSERPPAAKAIVFGERPVAPEPSPAPAASPLVRPRSQTALGRDTSPVAPPTALPFAPPPPPSSKGQLAGGLPFQAPRPPPSSSGLPFVSGPDAPDAQPVKRAMMTVGAHGTPLAYPPTPFSNAGPRPSAPPPRAPLATLPDSSPPPPPIAASRPGTVPPPPPTVEVAPAAAVPFVMPGAAGKPHPFEVPSYARRSFAAHVPDEQPHGGLGFGQGAAPAPDPEVKRIEGHSLEELARLRSELWSQPESRRAILRGHGLSELRWRVVERAWAAELEIMFEVPARAAEAVSRMRSAGVGADGPARAPDNSATPA